MERNPNLDFSRLQTGAAIPEVIETLGVPHEAWGSVLDPQEMIWVYRGLTDRSLLFFGSTVVQIFEAAAGGGGAFQAAIDVVAQDGVVELRRR